MSNGKWWTCSECKKPQRYGSWIGNKFCCIHCKPKYYSYQMIKGRIAEVLIEQLFLRLGYNVYRYGMENTIPGIINPLKNKCENDDKSDVSYQIRKMPDFVIQNDKGNTYFVEVKFRKDGGFSITNIENDYGKEYPFENVFFILVSKNEIKCLSYNQLKNDQLKIIPNCQYDLQKIKEFNITEKDQKIIAEFCDYAKKFFENVD